MGATRPGRTAGGRRRVCSLLRNPPGGRRAGQWGFHQAGRNNLGIAVIFDLVEKVRDLALGGDAEARAMIEKYERWQKQIEDGNPDAIKHSLDFERTLIDVTQSKFEFFEPQQLLELRRLREDRNRCAHPSYQRLDTPYRPSAELARLHLRNAVAFVLSQPPVQGKAAINALIS